MLSIGHIKFPQVIIFKSFKPIISVDLEAFWELFLLCNLFFYTHPCNCQLINLVTYTVISCQTICTDCDSVEEQNYCKTLQVIFWNQNFVPTCDYYPSTGLLFSELKTSVECGEKTMCLLVASELFKSSG